MIDYWEAIGRIAFGAALRNKILDTFPANDSYPTDNGALKIPEGDYQTIRNLVEPALTAPCLSLMGAGELLANANSSKLVAAFKPLAASVEAIQQAYPLHKPPSFGYYVTLGMMIHDQAFLQNLAARTGGAPFIPTTLEERAQLQALATPKRPFAEAAWEVWASRWEKGCTDLYFFVPGHLHPLGRNENGTPWAK